MKIANRDAESMQGNRAPIATQKAETCLAAAATCDAPAFHCPRCGQPVPDAAEVLRKHERFMKRLFARQEDFQRSISSAIHDDLAQQLAGALLYPEGSQELQGRPLDGATDSFQTGLKLLRDSIHDARRVPADCAPWFTATARSNSALNI